MLVIRFDRSSEDVVVPAVDLELVVGQGSGYFGMGSEIF